jgi:hypothetical protein
MCSGETYKNVVKLTFFKGAALDDPEGLFNSALDGKVRRTIAQWHVWFSLAGVASADSTPGIVPDAKDWTWVLNRRCPECGFDAGDIASEAVAARLNENAALWPAVLCRTDVRQRPHPARWSPLEYACHVRDVFRLYDRRLVLMLTEDNPLYPNWDKDSTAVEERYNEQDPATVTSELVAAGFDLAERFAGVSGRQWQRPGRRSDGAQFTIDTFSRYFLHDPVHHLHDVGR